MRLQKCYFMLLLMYSQHHFFLLTSESFVIHPKMEIHSITDTQPTINKQLFLNRYHTQCLFLNFFSGIQKMGIATRRRTRSTRTEPDARSTILSKLRPNLVWIDASRRRSDENQIVRTLPRSYSCTRSIIEFMGLC